MPQALLRALCAFGFLLCFALPASAQDPRGTWMTQDEDAKIEIRTCDDEADSLCGSIVWLKEPLEENGDPKLDDENPEPELRSRPLLGLEILTSFPTAPNKKGMFEGGKIYDAESGKTYSCHMSFKNDDQLKIRGYLGISLLGRTTVWSRTEAVAAPQKAADEGQASGH